MASNMAREGGRLKDALKVLEAYGLSLPDDTSGANLVERICVAGHARVKDAGLTDDEEDDLDGLGEPPAGMGGDTSGSEKEAPSGITLSLSSWQKSDIERRAERFSPSHARHARGKR